MMVRNRGHQEWEQPRKQKRDQKDFQARRECGVEKRKLELKMTFGRQSGRRWCRLLGVRLKRQGGQRSWKMLSFLGWAMCWWSRNSRKAQKIHQRRNSHSSLFLHKLTDTMEMDKPLTPLELSSSNPRRWHSLSRIEILLYDKDWRIIHRWSSFITSNWKSSQLLEIIMCI